MHWHDVFTILISLIITQEIICKLCAWCYKMSVFIIWSELIQVSICTVIHHIFDFTWLKKLGLVCLTLMMWQHLTAFSFCDVGIIGVIGSTITYCRLDALGLKHDDLMGSTNLVGVSVDDAVVSILFEQSNRLRRQ